MKAIVWFVLTAVLGTACSHNSTTTPTTPSTPTPTPVATPTIVETFSGTLPVGQFKFYSFVVAANGTVNARLDSVAGPGVPATVQLGIGIGTPAGIDCSATTTATVAADGVVTGTFGPGTFCVRVYDVGNLFAPAVFSVDIQHP